MSWNHSFQSFISNSILDDFTPNADSHVSERKFSVEMIMSYQRTCWCCSHTCRSMIDAPTSCLKVISWSDDKWCCFSSRRNIFRNTSKCIPSKSIIESKRSNVNCAILVRKIVIICFNESLIRPINSKSKSLIIHCCWLSMTSWIKGLSRLIICDVCNNIPRKTSNACSR